MAVTLTPGERQRQVGTFQNLGSYTAGTATTLQSISIYHDIVGITGSTATGFAISRLLLPTGGAVEGQEVVLMMLSTGEAKVVLTGTATGALSFASADQWAIVKFMNASWKVVTSGATLATATGTA